MIDYLVERNCKNLEPYPPEVVERFREAAATLRRAHWMAKAVDRLASGDTGDESFLKEWEEQGAGQ